MSNTTEIRRGMCPGCPWNVGDPSTEMAYNLGCLPSIEEATEACSENGQAWACHSEPDLVCCGFASRNPDSVDLPLRIVPGIHHSIDWSKTRRPR